jgi:hypothetical protein
LDARPAAERRFVMPHVPFQLRYTLSRLQRLVPHVRLWGVFTTVFVLAMLVFFCMQTVIAVSSREWTGILVFGSLAIGTLALFRGLFVGLIDALTVPRRDVDVVIEENTAAILLGNDRWCLFLDGITSINRYRADVWTFQHFNGSVLHVPVSAITDEQMSHIRSAMERGRTPDGVRAVIERGRRIEEQRRTGGKA